MRSLPIDASATGSAGSSRRSTPTDSIFSNCSSSNSSSPNSPPSLLQIPTQCSTFINTTNLSNQFSSDLLANTHPVLNTLNLASNILEQQVYKKPATVSFSETSEVNNLTTASTSISTSPIAQTSTNYTNNLHRNSPSSSTVSLSVRQSR